MKHPSGRSRATRSLAPSFVATVSLLAAACGEADAGGARGVALPASQGSGGGVAEGRAGSAGKPSGATDDRAAGGEGGGSAGSGGGISSASGGTPGSNGLAGNMGGSAGDQNGGAGAGSGGSGGKPNDPSCPLSRPLMSDPCVGAVVCNYPSSPNCGAVAACRGGGWKIEAIHNGVCNPPGVCPDDEPADAISGTCDRGGGFGGPARCRYARGACFSYLQCSPYDPSVPGGWRGWASKRPTDSCCPEDHAKLGEPCSEAGILCAAGPPPEGSSVGPDAICRDGVWSERPAPPPK